MSVVGELLLFVVPFLFVLVSPLGGVVGVVVAGSADV